MPGTFGEVDQPTFSAPQLDATYAMGPAQAGYLMQILLFGIFLSLFFECWSSGELARTGPLGRTALTVSLVLNSIYTALCFYEAYISSVWQNRTWEFLSNADAAFNALPLVAGLIAITTEAALAYRAGKLLPHAWLRVTFAVWMVLLILTVLTGSILACLIGIQYYTGYESVVIQWGPTAAIWLWASAIADVTISLACSYSLRTRILGFNRRTDSLLRMLIWIVLRTAAYTAIISIAGAVVESIYKDENLKSYIGNAFWLPTPALYGIALFTFSVSSRRLIDSHLGIEAGPAEPGAAPPVRQPDCSVEQKPRTMAESSGPLSLVSRLSRALTSESSAPRTPLIVTVQRETQIHVDEEDDHLQSEVETFGRPRGGQKSAVVGRGFEQV